MARVPVRSKVRSLLPFRRQGLVALEASAILLAALLVFVTLQSDQRSAPNATTTTPSTSSQPTTTGSTGDVMVVAAGDIAKSGTQDSPAMKTGQLISKLAPDAVLMLGDAAYDQGSAEDFRTKYAPTWGNFLAITKPVPGNHEYYTKNAAAYFDYFKVPEYYSYDMGAWHLIALNSEIDISDNSPQMKWLRNDLAIHKNACTLAYYHTPRFSTGKHGDNKAVSGLFEELARNNVDVILNGHDHSYQRWARLGIDGAPNAISGTREFVVGTGGTHTLTATSPRLGLEATNFTTQGVLQLKLRADGYDWNYLVANGEAFTDSGNEACH